MFALYFPLCIFLEQTLLSDRYLFKLEERNFKKMAIEVRMRHLTVNLSHHSDFFIVYFPHRVCENIVSDMRIGGGFSPGTSVSSTANEFLVTTQRSGDEQNSKFHFPLYMYLLSRFYILFICKVPVCENDCFENINQRKHYAIPF